MADHRNGFTESGTKGPFINGNGANSVHSQFKKEKGNGGTPPASGRHKKESTVVRSFESKTKRLPQEDLNTGFHHMKNDFWDRIGENFELTTNKEVSQYEFEHAMFEQVYVNQFLILSDGLELRVVEKPSPYKVVAKTLPQYQYNNVMEKRNLEQGLALALAMDASLPVVSLAGLAGSAKTMIALAAAIVQVKKLGLYRRVIVTRPLHGADKTIGLLPGTEEEKMRPWLGGIPDNLEALADVMNSTKKGEVVTVESLEKDLRLEYMSLETFKGRSFKNALIIIDEIQDIDQVLLKLICTRVAEDSKLFLLGNVSQIDNKSVTAETCGMSVFIDKFADCDLVGHITLQKCERSRFAAEAAKRL